MNLSEVSLHRPRPIASAGLTEQAGAPAPSTPQEGKEPRIVRVEANFLRLPLFALDNKHMRHMDGIRCAGTFRRGGETYAFTFSATRNTSTLYPGPLSRATHLAILSLATDRGFPLANPVVFSWRELLSRMGLAASGRAVIQVKQALLATKGLMIESKHALYSKVTGKPLDTALEMNQVVGIYEKLEFFGAKRPDLMKADINAVWLSHWYLDNLNALYSAPLNYDLWRSLADRSLIASRLYEFLFLKFYRGREIIRFNYPNLVKFIPVRQERYLSDARKQLDPAFELLCNHGVLNEVNWATSRDGNPQIHFRRGPVLSSAKTDAVSFDVGEDDFVLNQIEDVRLPEWEIVESYHKQWGHADYQPSKSELKTARELLVKYGKEQLSAMIPPMVKRMKMMFPDAKTFVAATRYVDEQAKEYQRIQNRDELAKEQAIEDSLEREQAVERRKRHLTLKERWDLLGEAQREEIRQTVLRRQPISLKKFPGTFDRFCLDELDRRS